MTLPGLFLWAALLYAAWLRLGWHHTAPAEVPALRRNAVLMLAVCFLPASYTMQEYGSWAHLTFPFSLLVWAALLVVALVTGLIQLARGRFGSGWPLLGLPAVALGMSLLNALLGGR
ncbi:hypothetical protein [Deinococcus sp. PESE-13]